MQDSTIFVDGPTLHECLVRAPRARSERSNPPLVVGLYGGGGSADRFVSLWDELDNRRFVFAVPQAPYPVPNATERSFDWALWPTGDWEIIAEATRLTQEYIVNTIGELKSRLGTGETYLFGFSQGAIFAYSVGITHPGLIQGLICVGGPGLLAPIGNPFGGKTREDWLSEDAISSANALPVFIAHGTKDQEVKYDLALQSSNVLTEHGYSVTFSSFDGGHEIPSAILKKIAHWIEAPNKVP